MLNFKVGDKFMTRNGIHTAVIIRIDGIYISYRWNDGKDDTATAKQIMLCFSREQCIMLTPLLEALA
jgi:hypothetical protein